MIALPDATLTAAQGERWITVTAVDQQTATCLPHGDVGSDAHPTDGDRLGAADP